MDIIQVKVDAEITDTGIYDYTYTISETTGVANTGTTTFKLDDELPTTATYNSLNVSCSNKTGAILFTTADDNTVEAVDVFVKTEVPNADGTSTTSKYLYYRTIDGLEPNTVVRKGFVTGYGSDDIKLVTRKGTGVLKTSFVGIARLMLDDSITDDVFIARADNLEFHTHTAYAYINATAGDDNRSLEMGVNVSAEDIQELAKMSYTNLETGSHVMYAHSVNGYGASIVNKDVELIYSNLSDYALEPAIFSHADRRDPINLTHLSPVYIGNALNKKFLELYRDGDEVQVTATSGFTGTVTGLFDTDTSSGLFTNQSGQTITFAYKHTEDALKMVGVKIQRPVNTSRNGTIASVKVNNTPHSFALSGGNSIALDDYTEEEFLFSTPVTTNSRNFNVVIETGTNGANITGMQILFEVNHTDELAIKIPDTTYRRYVRPVKPTTDAPMLVNPGIRNPDGAIHDNGDHVAIKVPTTASFTVDSSSVTEGGTIVNKNIFTPNTEFKTFTKALAPKPSDSGDKSSPPPVANLRIRANTEFTADSDNVVVSYITITKGALANNFREKTVYDADGKLVSAIYRKGNDLVLVKAHKGVANKPYYDNIITIASDLIKKSFGFNTEGFEYLGFTRMGQAPNAVYGEHTYRFVGIVYSIKGNFSSVDIQQQPFNDTGIGTLIRKNGEISMEISSEEGNPIQGIAMGIQQASQYLSGGRNLLPEATIQGLEVYGIRDDETTELLTNSKGTQALSGTEVRLFSWDNTTYKRIKIKFFGANGSVPYFLSWNPATFTLFTDKLASGVKSGANQNATSLNVFEELAYGVESSVFHNTDIVSALSNMPPYFADAPYDVPYGIAKLNKEAKIPASSVERDPDLPIFTKDPDKIFYRGHEFGQLELPDNGITNAGGSGTLGSIKESTLNNIKHFGTLEGKEIPISPGGNNNDISIEMTMKLDGINAIRPQSVGVQFWIKDDSSREELKFFSLYGLQTYSTNLVRKLVTVDGYSLYEGFMPVEQFGGRFRVTATWKNPNGDKSIEIYPVSWFTKESVRVEN